MSNVQHGGDVMLYMNTGTTEVPVWTPFAHATSHSISHGMTPREISSKETGSYPEIKPGMHTLSTISISGLATWDGFDYYDLLEKKQDREWITFKLSGRPDGDEDAPERTEEAGDKYEEGTGLITELGKEAPHDGSATYSCTITVSGKTTIQTVTE
jgi:hypothetical protein